MPIQIWGYTVKISPLLQATRFLNLVREKNDSSHGQRENAEQNEQQDADSQKNEEAEFSREKLEEAIEQFHEDIQAKENGLNATAVGQGIGLKVLLKDGSGTLVRQLTGDEFLRLREAAQDGRKRGKILDQKL